MKHWFLTFTNVDLLLSRFHSLEQSPVLYFSALFAIIQLVFIFILSATLFTMLFIRARIEPVLKKKKELFSDYLLQTIWPDPNSYYMKMPEIGNLAKTTVKETVFKYVITLQGEEKEKAVGIYTKLGLLKDDIKKLRSGYWWHRLEALVNIELIAPENLDELVRPLVEDSHPLVGLYAVKVLSKSLNENEVINMLRLLRDWNYLRPDIIQEILDNFSKIFPDALARSLEENLHHPKFYDIMCIRSLAKTMFLDVSPALLLWAQPQLPEKYRLEAVGALGALGDDRTTPNLEKLLISESDEIAAEVLAALGKILGNRFVNIPNSLKNNPGPHVKRALMKLLEEN